MNGNDFERELLGAATLDDCVGVVRRYFSSSEIHFGHGTDNAADEAYWLVAALLGWPEEGWANRPSAEFLERATTCARARVESRTPLAYLLGEAWFAGLRFEVDRAVLVPRSPLAELIERGFAPWLRLEPGECVLEIGTGSGCIAVAIAKHCDGVRVVATDVDPRAVELASRNAVAHGVADRVTFVAADLYPSDGNAYKMVISNPPYVPHARLAALPAEYGHEPALGLDGGADGLEVVRRIVAGASHHLDPGGVLIVEVGESEEAFARANRALGVTWLDFERGGGGVLLVTREELDAATGRLPPAGRARD